MLLVSQWADELPKQTEELRWRIQAKDDLLVKMEEERTPVKQAASERLKLLDVIGEVMRMYWLLALKQRPGQEMTDLSKGLSVV